MIARALQARITRDLRLLAAENVQVGMTAFDKLMQTCHGHMDMIIKAYLVVLEQLLDARDATYPVLAANSVLYLTDVHTTLINCAVCGVCKD